MTQLQPLPYPLHTPEALHCRAVCIAAEAVQAHLSRRAPARVLEVSLRSGVQYALPPDPAMLQANRALREDLVMVYLAAPAAAQLLGKAEAKGQEALGLAEAEAEALALLRASLIEPEEQAVAHAYLEVLRARCTVALRRNWTEVQVVAAGLLDSGALDAEALGHRIGCAQHLRGKTLN